MEPKTKLEKIAYSLHRKLAPISFAQRKWAENGCFTHTGYKRKASAWCLECGTVFKDLFELATVTGFKCPGCSRELKIQHSQKRTYEESVYFTIFARKAEFQVLRHFIIKKKCRLGEIAQYVINECVQNWISPNGQIVNIARMTAQGAYYDQWSWSSPMEVRGPSVMPGKYEVHAWHVYPNKRIMPELRRNGFQGELHNISPHKLLPGLLNNPKLETLLKAGQYGLLKYFASAGKDLNLFWASIKICIRNNYIVEDALIWCDYMDLLLIEGKDVRNAHYVCPKNLSEAHDRYVERRQRAIEREQIKSKLIKAIKDEPEYREHIKRFDNISLKADSLTIEPLKTVQEIVHEADELKHCLFANNYHKKKHTLLLTAKVEGVKVETVEFSLEKAEVVQSRGLRNKTSNYHNQIIELVNRNKGIIMERALAHV